LKAARHAPGHIAEKQAENDVNSERSDVHGDAM
jgi:hypothetical protein